MTLTTSRNISIGRLVALFAALAVAVSLLGAATANATVSPRANYVKSGDWRTVATLWNTSAKGVFQCPQDAKIRVLYGGGWFSKSRQEQTLNCQTLKALDVGGFSILVARMQVKVPVSQTVYWQYIVTGP